MNKYIGGLVYVDAPQPGFYRLTAELGFESERAKCTIIALPGFITNFVTGRKLFFVRKIVQDKMNPAAVIHDQMYDKGMVTREMADAVFRDAMLCSGVAAWRAWAAWAAVRTFGGQFYNKP